MRRLEEFIKGGDLIWFPAKLAKEIGSNEAAIICFLAGKMQDDGDRVAVSRSEFSEKFPHIGRSTIEDALFSLSRRGREFIKIEKDGRLRWFSINWGKLCQ